MDIRIERDIAAAPADFIAWLVDPGSYTRALLALREKPPTDGVEATYGKGATREIAGVGAWSPPSYDEGFECLDVKSYQAIEHDGGRIVVEPSSDRPISPGPALATTRARGAARCSSQ